MNDLISRQAAIDALDSIGSLDTYADREYARGIFNALPSVQPEIIRCKDCKFNYGNSHHCDFNPSDIVCEYWASDGLTTGDFCSYGERKDGGGA